MCTIHTIHCERVQAEHFASEVLSGGTNHTEGRGGNAFFPLSCPPCLQLHLAQLSIGWAAESDVIGAGGGYGRGGRRNFLLLPPLTQPPMPAKQSAWSHSMHCQPPLPAMGGVSSFPLYPLQNDQDLIGPDHLPGPQVQSQDRVQALQSIENQLQDQDPSLTNTLLILTH